MKKEIILYVISLIIILISIFVIIEFYDNQRIMLISGFLIPIGLGLNIASFVLTNKKSK